MSHQDDDEGSVSGESSSYTSITNTGTADGQASEQTSLAGSETRRVRRTKWLLAGVLCLVAVGLATATYVSSSTHQHDEFELRVRTYSLQAMVVD